jgi:hypothetical protein
MELTQPPHAEPPALGPALVDKLVEEAVGLERVLERRETSFGAALERDLFPSGAPDRVLPCEVRRALSDRIEHAIVGLGGPSVAPELAAPLRHIAASVRASESDDAMLDLLFPAGIPARVSAEELLRAFRTAASRELRSLVRLASLGQGEESWDTLVEHEVAGRLVLAMRLWVVCLRWYALAAGRVGSDQARSFGRLLEKWQRLERTSRQCIDA